MPSRDMQQYLDPKYSTVLPVSFNKKDLLIYAVGIGCNDEKWVYAENESFEMFPTFPVSLFFKGDSADAHVMRENPVAEVLNPPFPSKDFGVRAGLDGERYIECVRPLPVEGGSFVWKTDYTAITRKGASGILTEYETTLEGTDGTVYYRFWSAQFSLGKIPEFDDAGVSQGLSVTMPQRAPDATERFQTSPLQSFMYSLTGDFNAPHMDQALGERLGYGGVILQGLGSCGISSRAVLRTYGGNEGAAFHSVRVRFSKPVLPGQTLETQMWLDTETVCVETGDTVISNAYMDLKLQPPIGKL